MTTSTFHLPDMCCSSEQTTVRARLSTVAGIESVEFNALRREVMVTHTNADGASILKSLESLRLGAPQVTAAAHKPTSGKGRGGWAWLALSGLLAAGAEALAWSTGHEDSVPVIALVTASVAAGGGRTLKKGWLALRSLTFNIHFLMTASVVGAALLRQWPEAAMVTFLFAIAERLEQYSLHRARNAIGALVKLKPEHALVSTCCGDWSLVPAATVRTGQVVRVRADAMVPLDGMVLGGQSLVNQAPITGESWPVEKLPGSQVYASTINGSGTFDFLVTATSEGTTLARIIRAVQRAQAVRGPTQRYIDTFAGRYTPSYWCSRR